MSPRTLPVFRVKHQGRCSCGGEIGIDATGGIIGLRRVPQISKRCVPKCINKFPAVCEYSYIYSREVLIAVLEQRQGAKCLAYSDKVVPHIEVMKLAVALSHCSECTEVSFWGAGEFRIDDVDHIADSPSQLLPRFRGGYFLAISWGLCFGELYRFDLIYRPTGTGPRLATEGRPREATRRKKMTPLGLGPRRSDSGLASPSIPILRTSCP